jgi:hypothetical protein
MRRLTTTLREQQADAAKIAAACLPKLRRRHVAANLPVRRSGSEGGKELGYGG